MKKRIVLFVLFLLLTSLLTACSKPPMETEPGTKPVTTAPTLSQVDPNEENFRGDVMGEWSVVPRYGYGAFSDLGYYYVTHEGFLYFLDISNGISVRLCSNVNCRHEKETNFELYYECEAFIGGDEVLVPMFFANDRLYYITLDYLGTHLYSRNAVGLEVRKEATLCKEYMTKERTVTVYEYLQVNGKLYYTAEISTMVWNDAMQTDVLTVEAYEIRQLNLSSGEDRALLTVTKDPEKSTLPYPKLRAASSESIVYFLQERKNIGDGKSAITHTAVIQSQKDNSSFTLWEKLGPQINTDVYDIQDGILYMEETPQDKEKILRGYDLRTGALLSEAPLVEGETAYLNSDYRLHYQKDTQHTSIYNMHTGQILNGGIDGYLPKVYGANDQGFVFRRSFGHQVNKNHISIDRQILCYCSFESLADGLQEEDLTVFYEQSNK